MADINVSISYEGTEQGAEQIDGLTQSLGAATSAQQRAAQSATQLAAAESTAGSAAANTAGQMTAQNTAVIASTNKWEAFGGVISQVGPVLGSLDPQLQGIGQTLSVVGGSFTALTGALGPVAAGMAIATIAAQALNVALQQQEVELNDVTSAADTATDRIRSLASEMQASAGLRQLAAGGGTVAATQAALERTEFELEAASETVTRTTLASRFAAANLRNASREFADEGALRQAVNDAATAARTAVHETERLMAQRRELGEGLRVATRREAEHTAEVERGARAAAAARAAGARRGGGGGDPDRARVEAQRRADSALARGRAREAATIAEAWAEWDREKERVHEREVAREDELAAKRLENAQAEIERIRRESAAEIEAIEKAKSARTAALDQRRAENAEIAATLTQITTAVTGAFEAAIEGEKSLEEAMLEATKQLLKQFGTEMVAKGIGKILEGIANLPSPTAAPMIAGGAAMVGFGIGLGAAGAAIPSAPAGGGEAPREEPGTGDGGGPSTLVLNVNNPVMSASTHAQLSRNLRRQVAADRTFAPELRGRRA